MAFPLEDVCCARVAAACLPLLAGLRCVADVTVAQDGTHVWLRWPVGNGEVACRVLSLPGVELYEASAGAWRRHGSLLPAAGPPGSACFEPLHRVLVPEPVQPQPPESTRGKPARLRLVRESAVRPARA